MTKSEAKPVSKSAQPPVSSTKPVASAKQAAEDRPKQEKLTKRDAAILLAAQCIRRHLRGIDLEDDEMRDEALDAANQEWLEQANEIFTYALDHLGLVDE